MKAGLNHSLKRMRKYFWQCKVTPFTEHSVLFYRFLRTLGSGEHTALLPPRARFYSKHHANKAHNQHVSAIYVCSFQVYCHFLEKNNNRGSGSSSPEPQKSSDTSAKGSRINFHSKKVPARGLGLKNASTAKKGFWNNEK